MFESAADSRPVHATSVSPAVLAQAADALAWPLMLLRADAGLMHANLAAWQGLRAGQPFRLTPQQRVAPAAAAHRAAFHQALAAVAAGHERRTLHWPGADVAATATLVPLGEGGRAPVPVLMALGTRDRQAEVAGFASLHGLTPAETRVLQRLLQGDNSTRAAGALGSSPATVRSQIVALRRKTGHADVGALLQAVARLPPLGPPIAQAMHFGE